MKRVTDYFGAAPAQKKATSGAASLARAAVAPRGATAGGSAWDKEKWTAQLTSETRELLELELTTLDQSWLEALHHELTKPYFLGLKRFLKAQKDARATVFPPEHDIYSWSRLTPLHNVKVLILGQDPYHNVGQAHGLAFSVRPPTRAPPSLVNIYKELKGCYPDTFEIPSHGSLLKWAKQGVLMLNACLTVEAHKANSHAGRGWEQFTEQVIKAALKHNPHVVVMAWGSPAAKRVDQARPGPQHLVLKSVHPSPLSASRGWFGTQHFTKANAWLDKQGVASIDWHLLPKKQAPPRPEAAESNAGIKSKSSAAAEPSAAASESRTAESATTTGSSAAADSSVSPSPELAAHTLSVDDRTSVKT